MANKTVFTYYEVGAREECENDMVLGQFRNRDSAEKYLEELKKQYEEFLTYLHSFPLTEDGELDIFTKEHGFVWGDKYDDIPMNMLFHAVRIVEEIKRYGKASDEDYCSYYLTEQSIEFDD